MVAAAPQHRNAGPAEDAIPSLPDDLIVLATVGAPHGVKGEVRVKSFTTDPLALRDYRPLRIVDGRAVEIERLRAAKGVLVVKFRGVDDRDAAEALKGVALGVERSALPAPEPDEFYHADLIGLDAVDAGGRKLGTVAAVFNHGAGDILEIARDMGPSILLPFTQACVPAIDIAARRIAIVLPEESEIEEEEA